MSAATTSARAPIGQGRLARVGVADQRDNLVGPIAAARPLHGAPALDSLQLPLDADNALPD